MFLAREIKNVGISFLYYVNYIVNLLLTYIDFVLKYTVGNIKTYLIFTNDIIKY